MDNFFLFRLWFGFFFYRFGFDRFNFFLDFLFRLLDSSCFFAFFLFNRLFFFLSFDRFFTIDDDFVLFRL